MNQRKPPFDNVKVRQAVMHALNRKFIVDNIFFGLGKVATGPISSSTPFYSADVPKYDYDLKKARALIKESGVDLSKTPVKILAYPYGATWDRLGEITPSRPCSRSASTSRWTPPTPAPGPSASPTPSST